MRYDVGENQIIINRYLINKLSIMKRTSQLLVEPYKNYLMFISECRSKLYEDNLVIHNHHIIPRSLGGDNTKKNLVLLSVEDHIAAHLLLGKCFDDGSYEQISNFRSARLLNKQSIKDKEILDQITKTYIGENNPFYGKTHSDETRYKISEKNKEFNKLHRTGIKYEDFYGESKGKEQRQIRSESSKKVWDQRSDEDKRAIIEKVAEKNRGKVPWNKGKGKTVEVNGKTFNSIKEATEYYNTTKFYLFKNYDVKIMEKI